MLNKKLLPLLFVVVTSAAFAQKKTSKEIYRIKISKEENGKTLNIDTTFTDAASFNKFIRENDIAEPPAPPAPPPTPPLPPLPPSSSLPPIPPLPPLPPNGNLKAPEAPPLPPEIDMDAFFSAKDKQELEKAMEQIKEEMKNFRFELYSDDENGKHSEFLKEFKFNNDSLFVFHFNSDALKEQLKCLDSLDMNFNFNFSTDDGDKKNIKKSVIIIRDKQDATKKEKKKEDKAKKKAESERKADGDSYKLELENLNISPNPSTGRFKLSFSNESKSTISIFVYDSNGSEVYNEKLNDFAGTYIGELNLESKSKGSYVLKIKQDNRWLSKQIVIN